MNNIQDMTNDEFISHLMTGYSKHGALVQMVIMDCLQRGLDDYIGNKEQILADYKASREAGNMPFINMEAWVACCEETKQRIEEKYNPKKELVN